MAIVSLTCNVNLKSDFFFVSYEKFKLASSKKRKKRHNHMKCHCKAIVSSNLCDKVNHLQYNLIWSSSCPPFFRWYFFCIQYKLLYNNRPIDYANIEILLKFKFISLSIGNSIGKTLVEIVKKWLLRESD